MNAQELLRADGTPVGVYCCSRCNRIDASKERVERCCQPPVCNTCGAPCNNWLSRLCDSCVTKVAREREAARFAEAEKIPIEDYQGVVMDLTDEYWGSVAEYFEDRDNEGKPYDEYLWTCKASPFVKINLDEAVVKMFYMGYEGFDLDDLVGLEEVTEAINVFMAANASLVRYDKDFSRAVVITR